MLIGCAKGKRKVAVSVLSMLEDAIHCHLDKFSIKRWAYKKEEFTET